LEAIDQVKSGISVCIFPEGTRNRNAQTPDSLLPFKDGAMKIAQKSGCPIIPIALVGSDDVLEKHVPWIYRSEVTIVFGKPIILSELSKEDQKRIGGYCQNVLQNMLQEEVASRNK
jgi:1-acyl-sn-glycerol-3-phosphate acyltransferase